MVCVFVCVSVCVCVLVNRASLHHRPGPLTKGNRLDREWGVCLEGGRDGQNEGGMEGGGGWKGLLPDTYINPWLPPTPGVWSLQLARRRFSVAGPPNGATILAWCCQRAITSPQHYTNTDTTAASHGSDFTRLVSWQLTFLFCFLK